MAALRYKDEHNKVGYLLKPTRSDDYHQIIDFLRTSHIRYALTHNPIIFDSLVKQFWSTATLGSPELADDGGIADLPIAEIYSGMDSLGTKSGSWDQFGSPIAVALIYLSDERRFNWSSYIFKGMVAAQAVPHHMSVPDQPQDHLSTPYDKPLGGSFHMSPPQSTQAPPACQLSGGTKDPITLTALSSVVSTLVQKVNSLETELKDHKKLFKDVVGKLVKKVKAIEDPITLTALSSVVSTLVQKVNSLETELKDHKKLFKDVVGKLVKKVKAIEVKLKTKKRKMVASDSDQKKGGKQDVDLDALHALAKEAVTVDSNISPGGASHNPAASTSVPTVVPTGATDVPAGASTIPPGASTIPPGTLTIPAGNPSVLADVSSTAVPAGVSNKGKSPIVEEDIPVKARTFKQMEEDRLGEEAAKRLHDEEQAQLDRQEQSCNDEDNKKFLIQPSRMAALIKRKRQALAEKLAHKRQNRPMTQAQQRTYMRQYVKNQSSAVYTTGWTMAYVKSFTDDQLKEEFEKIRKTFIKVVSSKDSDNEAPPVWSALVGWEVLFDSHKGGKGSCVWQHQDLWEIRSWRLYTLSNVHVLETVFGEVFYMFFDVSYPLSVHLMERMLTHKLEIDTDVVGNDMTTAE
uniref:Aminoacyl-tRNA synthetase, class 1a, anticodon-binding n=1 Tax=Tanacetum cinerariifolium TaxID=118510 RepID=A0A6L2MD06_TANCI|nr:aminoacyl-tRNA synthetase, class 1a, anticodon-binding [Tanacetum cinerariifolium]